MFDFFSQLHFIRPMWFLALPVVIIIIAGLILKSTQRNQWLTIIDPHLLQHLLVGQKKIQQSTISPMLVLTIALLLTVISLAGPSWQKRPLPVFEAEISKVILLDLSLSMESTDIKPSRLTRAKYKIKDLLSKTIEGQIALIVYAGDAFVISPLTTDAKTILTMIPPLSSSLMPVLGSEPHTAFILADELLSNAGVYSGQIIWITDGIDDRDYRLVAEQLKNSRHQISILAVGTSEGAPIPLPDGRGFLKDEQGGIVLPTLQLAPLQQLANIGSGTLTPLSADDRDIEQLLSSLKQPDEFIASDEDREMDSWIEFGPWLLLPIILITALAFRKGMVIALFLLFVPIIPSSYEAAEQTTLHSPEPKQKPSTLEQVWKDLWQTSDQQAAVAFNNNQPKTAADLFEQPDWKSAALYKSGQYNAASDLLSASKSATANYNRGNALAKSERFEAAISAYTDALQQLPNMEDAKFNKALVEELLKQQQESEQKQKKDEQQQKDGEKQQQDNQPSANDKNQQQEQAESDQKQQEEEQKQQQEQNSDDQTDKEQQSEIEQMNDAEREQALEQWLRMIKDDPGGLLRRKMYMEYQRRQQQGKNPQQKGEKVW